MFINIKNKKKLWWLALPIGVAALWFGFFHYLYITEPPLYDEYPEKSTKDKFMLFNDGCCCIVTDFSVWLSDETGEEYPLFSHASPPYGKRIVADFPQEISGEIHAVVSFYYEYGIEGFVTFPIMDFENLSDIKNNGLLLIFSDGTLKVKSGRREAMFSYNKAPWADILSVTKYSDTTGKYYEETAKGYKAVLYDKDEITIEKIGNWLSTCTPQNNYYQYIFSDPDSWDMFIYYSPTSGLVSKNSFKFSVDGSIVKIYVTTDGLTDTSTDYMLIRVQAPLSVAWPNSSELYIDGRTIPMTISNFGTNREMTLDDVKELAKFGENLLLRDIWPMYAGIDSGSGGYIITCPVDGGMYQIRTGGGSLDTSPLSVKFGIMINGQFDENAIDIRYENIDDYLAGID